ncbi:MAG: NADH-quinone oxidoreductase subunit NuoK [Lacipirellulaceae bacterium]
MIAPLDLQLAPLLAPVVASVLTEPIGVAHYMVVGAVMFTAGVMSMAVKRNLLGVLMGVELVLNAAIVNFVAIGSPYLRGDDASVGLDGQLMALFVIVLAAAEAAVALAIALNYYQTVGSIDVDQANQLRG